MLSTIIGQITSSEAYLQRALDPLVDPEEIKAQSLAYLPENASDSKRYKFTQKTPRERALNVLFTQAFQLRPEEVIAVAESNSPSKTPFYPRWKSVCRIGIPKAVGATIDNPLIKIALTIAALYFSYVTCKGAYRATTELTIRSLSFVINHTPVQIIRLGNKMLDVKDYARNHVIEILFCTWIARAIILRVPEMPVITPIARRIDLWNLWNVIVPSYSTLSDFLWQNARYAASFTWKACTHVGEFMNGRASQAERERLVVCREKAFKVWQDEVRGISLVESEKPRPQSAAQLH